MSGLFGVIGGSGLYQLGEDFAIDSEVAVKTPYGETSAKLQIGQWQGIRVAFLPRHGQNHQIPPHKINYRANLWAFKNAGVSQVIAANAVGGISSQYAPETVGLPDQIIDYSSGREHSFYDGEHDSDYSELKHIDFTYPYSQTIRTQIKSAANHSNFELVDGGTYGCTNGPRFESAAEIRKMQNDGCHLVGMTGMPEAALARELGLEYASIALVVNWCAGIDEAEICLDDIYKILETGVERVRKLIHLTLAESLS